MATQKDFVVKNGLIVLGTTTSLRNAGTGAFDFLQKHNGTLTASRTLTWNLNNVDRTISLGGNLTLANSFTTAGNFALTLTTTAATNVTLPTSGTLVTTTGSISGNAGSATNVAGGAANQIHYQTGSGATSFISAPSTASTYLQWTGSAFAWVAVSSGTNVTIANDTTTNGTFYPTLSTATSGTASTLTTSSTKLSFNPSTGTLTATTFSGALSGNATSATTASNLDGGANGSIPYQTGSGSTSMLAAGASKQVLTSNGAGAPSWATLDMTYVPDSAFKKSVRVASTANMALSGGTAFPTIDGVVTASGDRVLLKNQSTQSQNGIYQVGGTATAWTLTRTADSDSASEIASALLAVDAGTTNGGRMFTNVFKATDTIGTTNMPWYEMAMQSNTASFTSLTATTGLTVSGTTVNVGSSTATHTSNFGYGATVSGSTKTVNVGTGGVAGSTTNINIGSSAGTSTTNVNGTLNVKGAPVGGLSISATPPSSPNVRDQWLNSDTGKLYVYYNDGTSSQWVEFAGVGFTVAALAAINPSAPKTGDIQVSAGVVSIYANGSWNQIYPAVYS